MQIITIGRGGNNTKPLKIILEEPDESIYITTPQELEKILCEIIDGVSPFNVKINLDLIKDTKMGVISV